MRNLIREKYKDHVFVGCEAKIQREDKKKFLTPDLIVWDKKRKMHGFVEIKTSLCDDVEIVDQIGALKKYDEKLSNVPLRSKEASECIVFSPEITYGAKSVRVLAEENARGQLLFEKPFLIWQWSFKEDINSKETLFVQQIFGDKEALGKLSKDFTIDGVSIDISGNNILNVDRELCHFISKKPSKEYTAVVLENHIFNYFRHLKIEHVTIRDVMHILKKTFPQKLMNIKGKNSSEQFEIKEKWIAEALDLLVKCKLIEKIGSNYVFRKTKIKDIKEKICKTSARIDLEGGYSFSRSLLKK